MLQYNNIRYHLIYSGITGIYFLHIPELKIKDKKIKAADGKKAIIEAEKTIQNL